MCLCVAAVSSLTPGFPNVLRYEQYTQMDGPREKLIGYTCSVKTIRESPRSAVSGKLSNQIC